MEATFKALSNENWQDLEALFGANGACGGCWCMTMRLTSSDYEEQKGAKNKSSLRKLVRKHQPVGVLAYSQNSPVGWCSVAPREHFVRLSTSRIFKPVDDAPVWSIVCLFIKKNCRRMNLSGQLIRAAVRYAGKQGALIVEAYPQIPRKENVPDVFAFCGIASAFERAGFVEVARRSETRPVMRFTIRDSKGQA